MRLTLALLITTSALLPACGGGDSEGDSGLDSGLDSGSLDSGPLLDAHNAALDTGSLLDAFGTDSSTSDGGQALDSPEPISPDAGPPDVGVDAPGPDTGPCPVPQMLCGATCVDTRYDEFNCGTCSNVCMSDLPNRVPNCLEGTCRTNCAYGWGECNGDRSDGCETDLERDRRNCGVCERVCAAGESCSEGRCVRL